MGPYPKIIGNSNVYETSIRRIPFFGTNGKLVTMAFPLRALGSYGWYSISAVCGDLAYLYARLI